MYFDKEFKRTHCLLRARNNMVMELKKELADAIAHNARHQKYSERFVAYATDHKDLRLYVVKHKSEEKYVLVLQKNFSTVANVVVNCNNDYVEEFNKTADHYGLQKMWGGGILTLTGDNIDSTVESLVSIIVNRISGQRGRIF